MPIENDSVKVKQQGTLLQRLETGSFERFCQEFELDPTLGMHLTNKQLKKKKCFPPLFYAILSGNVKMVEEMLRDNKVILKINFALPKGVASMDVSGIDWHGITAMHVAAYSCNGHDQESSAKLLQLLIDAGGNPYLWTPYFFSAMGLAINQSNDFFWRYMKNNFAGFSFDRICMHWGGQSMLHPACQMGNLDLLQEAYDDGADFDIRGFPGGPPVTGLCLSPLDANYRNSPAEIWQFLLDNKILDVNVRVDPRKSPKHILSSVVKLIGWYSRWEYFVRKKFTSKEKALANMHVSKCAAAILKNQTPLHNAAERGSDIATFKYLIEKGADLEAQNAMGLTPLDLAVHSKNLLHAEILRNAMRATGNGL